MKSYLRPFILAVWLSLFSLLAPPRDASARAALRRNVFKKKFDTEYFLNSRSNIKEFTLPGIVSPHFVPGSNAYFVVVSDPKTREAYAIIYNDEGTIIKSIPIPYVERGGEPSRNGFASIEMNQNTFVVLGADTTIYIYSPDGQEIIPPTTFDLKGRIWATPILSAINDEKFYIIVPTDSMYYEGGQSKHDIYIYTFIYNVETNTIDFALSRQPIFKIEKASLGRDDPALDGNLLFFTVTYNEVNYSEIYAVNIQTGEVKKGWPQPLGLFSTAGPAAFKENGVLREITAGTVESVGEKTIRFFLPDSTQPWEPYRIPGDVLSAPIYADINGDHYPDILVIVTKGTDVTLIILDGKTKKPIEPPQPLGNYPVKQVITADLDADRLIEIIYRTQADGQNKVVILHLDKEGHVVSSQTEEILLENVEDKEYSSQGPLSIVRIGDEWVLVVGAKYDATIDGKPRSVSDVYFIKLGYLSIVNMWPEPGCNSQNTSCLIFVPRFIPPEHFELSQNYPNPFGEETIIPFYCAWPAYVKITIYNVLGQKVRTLVDEELPAGYHERVWDGRNDKGQKVASGIYFYRLSINQSKQTRARKMLLLN